MFMGGTASQWIDLGIYMVGMIILFVFVGLSSLYLTNKYFNKNKLYKNKKKTVREKKWFYDVA